MEGFDLEMDWKDHEDIALSLYEKFGDEFNESKIYRIRFTDLHKWVTELENFVGDPKASTEADLEIIQSNWVYEWREGQK